MKKLLFTMLSVAALFSIAVAQQRQCGTMQYLQSRMEQDPFFEQRMKEYEQDVQQWIEKHPQEQTSANYSSKYPVISGFELTGDDSLDHKDYSRAKEIYSSLNPQPKKEQELTPAQIKERRESRKDNKLILINQ